jgi:hypothetical protein
MTTTELPGAPAPVRHSFVERLMGALRLDAATYEEVEHDASALGQAAGVVLLAALAAAIGTASRGDGGAIGAVFGALAGWLISTAFIWVVGVRWMNHTSDYRELLRTLGFASAPQILFVASGIPLLGVLIAVVAWGWGLAAFVVAVRQALDVTTGRALWVCVLAVLLNAACILGLAILLGGLTCAGPPGTVG